MLGEAVFWATVGLVIFLGVMVYLKVPSIMTESLDKRAVTIREELEHARKLREEAQALLAEYQRKAREAETEATEIVDQAKREAGALGEEAKQRLHEYIASRTKMAEQKIAQAEAQALQEVRALSADVSVSAAQAILAAKVKGEAGEAMIARAIEDVKSKLN
jgi:F-type H+-transporting ATPase subunit b